MNSKKEKQFLKIFILSQLYKVLSDLFQHKIFCNKDNDSMECYAMDKKMIQFIIHEIIQTGDYTLEGIAHITGIPFDIIYDAACGNNNQFSIIPWAKIADLYIQVKPEVAQTLIDKLFEIKEKNLCAISYVLNTG